MSNLNSNEYYQKEINKDMRICYLSVLSTLAQKEPDMDIETLKERARETTEYIFKLYPFPKQYQQLSRGEVRMENPEAPKTPRTPF